MIECEALSLNPNPAFCAHSTNHYIIGDHLTVHLPHLVTTHRLATGIAHQDHRHLPVQALRNTYQSLGCTTPSLLSPSPSFGHTFRCHNLTARVTASVGSNGRREHAFTQQRTRPTHPSLQHQALVR